MQINVCPRRAVEEQTGYWLGNTTGYRCVSQAFRGVTALFYCLHLNIMEEMNLVLFPDNIIMASYFGLERKKIISNEEANSLLLFQKQKGPQFAEKCDENDMMGRQVE